MSGFIFHVDSPSNGYFSYIPLEIKHLYTLNPVPMMIIVEILQRGINLSVFLMNKEILLFQTTWNGI